MAKLHLKIIYDYGTRLSLQIVIRSQKQSVAKEAVKAAVGEKKVRQLNVKQQHNSQHVWHAAGECSALCH